MKIKLTASIAVVLVVAQVLLVLFSWMLSATMTEGVHSLLSSEGIRWFLGQYAFLLQSPLLVWLLLLSMSFGVLSGSHLLSHGSSYRERVALRLSMLLLAVYVVLVLLMTLVPHAILLSPTGTLFPSPFSHAFVPLVAFVILLFSAVYGFVTHAFSSLSDFCQSMIDGISQWSPLFLLYVLFMQFYESVRYVFY